jgi:CDP-diglyceride synthetase
LDFELGHLLVFLPAFGAWLAHGPVLRFRLFERLAQPLDGGLTFRGARVFGDNKTWRGALVMFAGALILTVALWQAAWYVSVLPEALRVRGPWAHGAVLGLAVVVGELPNSFVKRQLGVAPGARRASLGGALLSIYDQADFVLIGWLLLAPLWLMPLLELVACFVAVAIVHVGVSLIGRAIGARRTVL